MIKKGMQGYVNAQMKDSRKKAIIGVVIFMSIYFIGIITTGSNKNFSTVLAVLIILPTAQVLARYVAYAKYYSISETLVDACSQLENTTVLYEVIIVRENKSLFFEAVIIINKCVFLLVKKKDKSPNDLKGTQQIIQTLMNHKGITTTVFVHDDLAELVDQLEGLNAINNSIDDQVHENIALTVLRNAM